MSKFACTTAYCLGDDHHPSCEMSDPGPVTESKAAPPLVPFEKAAPELVGIPIPEHMKRMDLPEQEYSGPFVGPGPYTSAAAKIRAKTRNTEPGLAIHSLDVLNASERLGEPHHDGYGYVGLTHKRLIELLEELHSHREDRERLRLWMEANLNLREDDKKGNPVIVAIRVMTDTKDVLTAVWPHLMTVWGNVSHVLRNAGILPPTKS